MNNDIILFDWEINQVDWSNSKYVLEQLIQLNPHVPLEEMKFILSLISPKLLDNQAFLKKAIEAHPLFTPVYIYQLTQFKPPLLTEYETQVTDLQLKNAKTINFILNNLSIQNIVEFKFLWESGLNQIYFLCKLPFSQYELQYHKAIDYHTEHPYNDHWECYSQKTWSQHVSAWHNFKTVYTQVADTIDTLFIKGEYFYTAKKKFKRFKNYPSDSKKIYETLAKMNEPKAFTWLLLYLLAQNKEKNLDYQLSKYFPFAQVYIYLDSYFQDKEQFVIPYLNILQSGQYKQEQGIGHIFLHFKHDCIPIEYYDKVERLEYYLVHLAKPGDYVVEHYFSPDNKTKSFNKIIQYYLEKYGIAPHMGKTLRIERILQLVPQIFTDLDYLLPFIELSRLIKNDQPIQDFADKLAQVSPKLYHLVQEQLFSLTNKLEYFHYRDTDKVCLYLNQLNYNFTDNFQRIKELVTINPSILIPGEFSNEPFYTHWRQCLPLIIGLPIEDLKLTEQDWATILSHPHIIDMVNEHNEYGNSLILSWLPTHLLTPKIILAGWNREVTIDIPPNLLEDIPFLLSMLEMNYMFIEKVPDQLYNQLDFIIPLLEKIDNEYIPYEIRGYWPKRIRFFFERYGITENYSGFMKNYLLEKKLKDKLTPRKKLPFLHKI